MNRAEERRWGRSKLLRHGELLRAARLRSKLSLTELSRRANMSRAQLSDIERGIGPLSLRRARQLAIVLGESFLEVVQAVLQDRVEDAGFSVQVSVSSQPALARDGGPYGEEDPGRGSNGRARGA